MLGRQRDRLVEILSARNLEDRPEDFVLVRFHAGAHMVEQRAAHIETVFVALQLEAAAVDHQLGAFLEAHLDIGSDLVAMRCRHQWTVIRFRIGGRSDFQRLDTRLQPGNQGIGELVGHRHRDRNRHAAFACRTVARADQFVRHLVEIGVRHDDGVVLRAAHRLHAFAARSSVRIHIFGDG